MNYMLKELICIMLRLLALFLNKSISQGVVTIQVETSICLIYLEKSARNRAENYRPISMTSIVCKLLETLTKRML